MKQGMFIVIEGIDGAGTTTQSKLLAEWFSAKEFSLHLTYEPSRGRVGALIREYLAGNIDVPDIDRHFHSLALLFAADRLDHLAREVEPNLKEGRHVISDRYVLSSLVYQSLHCDPQWVREINSEATPPHLTILLDLPVDTAMERLARRSLFKDDEIYETAEQQEKIRELYLKTVRELYTDQDIVLIDGGPDPDKVHQRIVNKLEPRLQSFLDSQQS